MRLLYNQYREFVKWFREIAADLTPPWVLTDDEFYQEVKRGNSATYYGLEYARDWWLRVLFVAGLVGFFVYCWVTGG